MSLANCLANPFDLELSQRQDKTWRLFFVDDRPLAEKVEQNNFREADTFQNFPFLPCICLDAGSDQAEPVIFLCLNDANAPESRTRHRVHVHRTQENQSRVRAEQWSCNIDRLI